MPVSSPLPSSTASLLRLERPPNPTISISAIPAISQSKEFATHARVPSDFPPRMPQTATPARFATVRPLQWDRAFVLHHYSRPSHKGAERLAIARCAVRAVDCTRSYKSRRPQFARVQEACLLASAPFTPSEPTRPLSLPCERLPDPARCRTALSHLVLDDSTPGGSALRSIGHECTFWSLRI